MPGDTPLTNRSTRIQIWGPLTPEPSTYRRSSLNPQGTTPSLVIPGPSLPFKQSTLLLPSLIHSYNHWLWVYKRRGPPWAQGLCRFCSQRYSQRPVHYLAHNWCLANAC